MHTTEEAKLTWCPFALVPWRMFDEDGVEMAPFAANRGETGGRDMGGETPYPCCIADQCSQWVWVEEVAPNPDGAGSNEKPYVKIQNRGFCGRNVAMAMKVFGK